MALTTKLLAINGSVNNWMNLNFWLYHEAVVINEDNVVFAIYSKYLNIL